MNFKEGVFKKGGTLPILEIVVGKDGYDGFVTDPTNAVITCTVSLRSNHATKIVNNLAGSIADIVQLDDETYQAKLRYAWTAGQRDTLGEYDVEFKVVMQGGGIIFIPPGEIDEDGNEKKQFYPIRITESLS